MILVIYLDILIFRAYNYNTKVLINKIMRLLMI